MAVGKGSIKRASNAAKAKTEAEAVTAGGEAVSVEVANEEVLDSETKTLSEEKKEEKPAVKKQPAKKTTKKTPAKKSTTAKSSGTKKAAAAKKTVADEKKTYEVVEGITCNMPKYLL